MARPVPQPAWAILENGVAALWVAAMGAWMIGGNVSILTVLDFHIGLSVLGAWFLSFPWISKFRAKFGVGCLAAAVGGFFLFAIGASHLIGDHLLARQFVQGPIQNLRTETNARGPDELIVKINDQEFKATTRLFETLKTGENVRAEVGQGSGYIFRLERLPTR